MATITEVTVHVNRKLDIGYHPYMAYLESLNGGRVEFGTRENSNTELGFFLKASVEEGDDPNEVAASLANMGFAVLDNKLRSMYPYAFGPDVAAFQVDSVEVDFETDEEDF